MSKSLYGLNARLLSGSDELEFSFDARSVGYNKAELMGRLCYCGFDITAFDARADRVCIRARKVREPVDGGTERRYGCIVALPRVGYRGKTVNVYKFRTMYPYSEYLQEWIYRNNRLADGGVFANDFRITPLGRWLRKSKIDELPMLCNLLRGDVKLVGVRPLSPQFFGLYSEALQRERVRHRPGLIPPFYADMPRLLSEVEESEMRYLSRCNTNGTVATDFRYLFLVVNRTIKRLFDAVRRCF